MKKQRGIRYKTACMTLVFCMLLFSLNGCGDKGGHENDTQSNIVSEEQTDTDTAEAVPDEDIHGERVKLPIAERDCALSEHAVPDNPGFYEIDCKKYLDDIESIYTFCMYEDALVILYEDSAVKMHLAIIDPYTLQVTGPISVEDAFSFNSGLFTDSRGRLALYNGEEQCITYYNRKLEEEELFEFDNVETDSLYFSENGAYGYYFDDSENAVMQYDIEKNQKNKLYDMSDIQPDFRMINGVFQDRYVGMSYMSGEDQYTNALYDIEEKQMVYSGEHAANALRGYGDSFSLLYEMDGMQEIICGEASGDRYVFMLPNMAEYDYFEREQRSNSLITYETHYESEDDSNTVLFRGYDMYSGQMKHEGTFTMQNFYGVTAIAYSQNLDYMPFLAAGEKPVIYIWDLLEADSQVTDARSYLRTIPNSDNPDETELRALKERAKTLGKRFGVDINIADDIHSCPVFDYEYTEIDNHVRIEQTLDIMERELAKYPEGMLAQLDDDMGGCLQIYLSGGLIGIMDGTLTDSRGIENTIDGVTFVVLDITDIWELDRTLQHEIFHAIEGHMNCEGYYFDYDRWMALNPDGFDYDYDYVVNEQNFDWDYVMSEETGGYFVDIYSKSYPHEDRARIMEYAMTEEKWDSMVFTYDGIRKKHTYICEQIRLAFDTEGWPEQTVWEKVLEAE